MKIAILTSSRADYGIYRPLISKFYEDEYFDTTIIAFGTHLSLKYGLTKTEIINDGFKIDYELPTTIEDDDSPNGINRSIEKTIEQFSKLWQNIHNNIDLVFCLGDRYEMFAAVVATIPFNINIAHIHGGEVTLGAIDNKFRNSLSLYSCYHFTSTETSAKNVKRILNDDRNVYNVGALGLDNILNLKLLDKDEFNLKYNLLLDNPILVTIHPETIDIENNINNLYEFIETLHMINDQVIITMPNADTLGLSMRKIIEEELKNRNNTFLIESFGTIGYFTCIKYCCMLVGNTSSGIIEAASFKKYVCNLGTRQKGRERSENVFDCSFEKGIIFNTINHIKTLPLYNGTNIYGEGKAAEKIIKYLKAL